MKTKRVISFFLALILALISFCSCDPFELLNAYSKAGKLICHYLDVGQGDSIFIELPNKKTMLIDSGENYHGEGIVKYMTREGHSRIDYLIATHPHSDHIGSMAYIVRHFDVSSVCMPKVSTNSRLYEDLLKAIKSKKLKVTSGKAGVNLFTDDEYRLKADIVAPSKLDKENLNNSSLMIRLTYRDSSFLFTGDAEKPELASISEKTDISADVLKVGHHGSSNATTKAFLERVEPKLAVISVGKNNDYGHPHKNVLKLLKNIGSEIHRTDKEGTVRISTDGGGSYTVDTGLNSIERVI
ncbi:MAG: ComEC/Rec2 family competence protein [Ruminococcus sp.]|nr:ComEC/Rec2 family competence protein [Ruminococcus sp.]